MDGWKVHYIAQCQFWFYKNVSEKLEKKGERCRTKYLEGTVMARGISEYLEGTAEDLEMVMCDSPGFMKEGGHV
jgi:hypothetical protein